MIRPRIGLFHAPCFDYPAGMLERVISGGQTGADQAGWRAARAAGIPTGGMMPKGFLTEDGPRLDFAELYGAREHQSPSYPPRTFANASDGHATVWFGSTDSLGYLSTTTACMKAGNRPMILVTTRAIRPADVARELERLGAKVVNVAGNRESKNPGIGARVEWFLAEVFRQLGKTP